jgi:hypothetical protein
VKGGRGPLRGGNDLRGSAGPDFVNIARCTIRLDQVDTADSDLFPDAMSSNLPYHRLY